MTIRVTPHVPGRTAMVVNGRTYTCTYGSTIDVPDHDAVILGANGWLEVAAVGTTAQRPSAGAVELSGAVAVGKNFYYIDTTLNKVIKYDGQGNWRDALTGAVV